MFITEVCGRYRFGSSDIASMQQASYLSVSRTTREPLIYRAVNEFRQREVDDDRRRISQCNRRVCGFEPRRPTIMAAFHSEKRWPGSRRGRGSEAVGQHGAERAHSSDRNVGSREGRDKLERCGPCALRIRGRNPRGLPATTLLTPFEPQFERGHLFAVSDKQRVANQHWMIPGLPFECFEARNFRELSGSCLHERQLPFF